MIRRIFTTTALVFALAACSSNDDKEEAITTPAVDAPVTGVFHNIEPSDVPAYVAEYEAQRARTSLQVEGETYEITYAGMDQDNGVLFATFRGNDLVFVSFDFEEEVILPGMSIVEVADDDETVVNSWRTNGELDLQESSAGDSVLSGTLTEAEGDEQIQVQLVINESVVVGGTSTLEVDGTDAILSGDMGTETYVQMRDMIAANPQVTRIVIQESSGSSNDNINVHTGRLIREGNLATHVPADGDINSGAVDLFTAGVTRTVEPGGILGVHSWCCEGELTADQLPKNSPAHGTQLTYFREMLGDNGEDFYFFTLQAAPFDGIHPMTREEMVEYGLIAAE